MASLELARPKAAFHTLGCKLNQYETEAIREEFERNGFEIVPFSSPADVYVINTCTVTAKSDRSSRQAVYQALRRSPRARVVATGCSAHVSPQSYQHIKGIELVVGNEGKGTLWQRLTGQVSPEVTSPSLPGQQAKADGNWFRISGFRNYTRAFIKIQDGCNAGCSYCIVPLARGPQRSRPLQSIIDQITHLVDSGYREMVLTGVHIGAYGVDRPEPTRLVDVLEALLRLNGVWRIRLSSIEPRECSPRLIDLLASSPRICRHLHIPLQSGDDETLGRMGRNYTTATFRDLIHRLIASIPDVSVGTDVIAGFPGETEIHFNASYEFIKSLPLSYIHVFTYSRRPGTAAADFPEQVPVEVKKVRTSALRRLRSEQMRRFQERAVGKNLQVVLEHRRDKETGLLTGLSDNYLRVMVEGEDRLQGQPVEVTVVRCEEGRLYGSFLRPL